jgi:Transmembrane domain of unknown function (DUF3566)
VTTNGGTGRPPSAPDVRDDDAPTVVDAPVAGSTNNGSGDAAGTEATRGEPYDRFGRGSHAASPTTKASTAYEVAAALRAQASRAAQATREAAHRVQDALNTQADPGQAVANGPASRPLTPPMAAVSGAATSGTAAGRPAPTGDRTAPPAGAAAAMAATAPVRPRHDAVPSSDVTRATERRPVEPPTFEPDRSVPAVPAPGDGADSAATAVAPDSAPVVAPVVPPPVEPAAPGRTETYATQVSVDARPEQAYAPPSARRTPTTVVRRSGRVRKARLRLLRIDPWSVMKTAFLLSVALGITVFVAVAVLWSVLDAAGVFSAVGDLIRDLTSSETGTGFELENYTALSRVLGFTTLIAVVDVVLVTALATLGAFLYNLSASLLGGLELTLAEDD